MMLLKLNNLAILNGNVTRLFGKWCIFLRIKNTEVLHEPHLLSHGRTMHLEAKMVSDSDGSLWNRKFLNNYSKTEILGDLSRNSNYENEIAQLL